MPSLKVAPAELRSASELVGRAAEGLARLHADAPLSDAAGAVPRLQTAQPRRKAQQDMAVRVAAAADAARQFGENLSSAARWYEMRDESAADAITKIETPS